MKFLNKNNVHLYEEEGAGEDEGCIERERKTRSRTINKPMVRGDEGKR